jgi:hypothetical protein
MLNLKSKITSMAVVAAIAITGTVWFTNRAHAQTRGAAGFLASGMVTIVSGQSLRLNAVSVNVVHDVPVELLLFDSQGNVVGRAVQTLAPGHSTSLEFHLPPGPIASRMQVRTIVRWATQLGTDGYIIPTLESVDDATGRTTVLEPDYSA